MSYHRTHIERQSKKAKNDGEGHGGGHRDDNSSGYKDDHKGNYGGGHHHGGSYGRNRKKEPHTSTRVKSSRQSKQPHGHESIRTILQRMAGNFLILFSLYMMSWVFYRPFIEEVKYTYNNLVGREYVVVDEFDRNGGTDANGVSGGDVRNGANDGDVRNSDLRFNATKGSTQIGLLDSILRSQKVQPLVPKDPNFSVVIPKLGANANVIANVNSAREDEYLSALEHGVAHAAGTALPGQDQHIYLFAHSTNTFSNVSRYNAIFYLLYKLENGDEINIFHEGIRHRYNVTGKTIVDPSEVQYLTKKTEKEFVTLQTCWPPGTVAQRMLVFAEPVR